MLHPDPFVAEVETALATEPSDKRYYQLLKLACLKLVGVYVEDDNDGIPTALDGAKAIFRSITEDKWGSSDKTEAGDETN